MRLIENYQCRASVALRVSRDGLHHADEHVLTRDAKRVERALCLLDELAPMHEEPHERRLWRASDVPRCHVGEAHCLAPPAGEHDERSAVRPERLTGAVD